jgi:hypothetical protein
LRAQRVLTLPVWGWRHREGHGLTRAQCAVQACTRAGHRRRREAFPWDCAVIHLAMTGGMRSRSRATIGIGWEAGTRRLIWPQFVLWARLGIPYVATRPAAKAGDADVTDLAGVSAATSMRKGVIISELHSSLMPHTVKRYTKTRCPEKLRSGPVQALRQIPSSTSLMPRRYRPGRWRG